MLFYYHKYRIFNDNILIYKNTLINKHSFINIILCYNFIRCNIYNYYTIKLIYLYNNNYCIYYDYFNDFIQFHRYDLSHRINENIWINDISKYNTFLLDDYKNLIRKNRKILKFHNEIEHKYNYLKYIMKFIRFIKYIIKQLLLLLYIFILSYE